jgi:hypothetical protein
VGSRKIRLLRILIRLHKAHLIPGNGTFELRIFRGCAGDTCERNSPLMPPQVRIARSSVSTELSVSKPK